MTKRLVWCCFVLLTGTASAAGPSATRSAELRRGLEAREPEARLRALAEIDADPSDVSELLVVALDDGAAKVRASAARALGRRRAVRAIAALATHLEDAREVAEVVSQALVAIAPAPEAGAALATSFRGASPAIRAALLPALAASPDAAAAAVWAGALIDADASVRAVADRLLRLASSDRATAAVAVCLESTVEAALVACAQMAREIRLTGVVGQLAAIAADDFAQAAPREAARAMVLSMKDELDAPALAERARTAPSRTDRAGALGLLALVGGDRTYAALTYALNDPDEFVRSTAASALGGFGDARAIGPLSKALQRPENTRISKTLQRAIDRLLKPRGPGGG